MQVQPYLQFDGRCEEAIEFYKSALGAKVEAIMRFKDGPDCMEMPQGTGGQGAACLFPHRRVDDHGVRRLLQGQAGLPGLLAHHPGAGQGRGGSPVRGLEPGGQVQMPLAETFFSPRFGMVADRFGVSWMIVTMPDGAKN